MPPLKCDLRDGDRRYVLPPLKYDEHGPWTLHRAKPFVVHNIQAMWDCNEKINRDPDSGIIVNIEDWAERHYQNCTTLLGFHPYQEVIFLGITFRRGLA